MMLQGLVNDYSSKKMSTNDLLRQLELHQRIPLSEGQKGLWVLQKMEPTMSAYNVPIGLNISGRIDEAKLLIAYHHLLEQHPLLRCNIEETSGQLHFKFNALDKYTIHSVKTGKSELDSIVTSLTRAAQRPFALDRDPLIRLQVFHGDGNSAAILITLHHIVCDGTSSTLLLDCLLRAYGGLVANGTIPSSSRPHAYVDFVRWQQQYCKTDQFCSDRQYWRSQLNSLPTSSGMLPNRCNIDDLEHLGQTHCCTLSSDQSGRITAMLDATGLTPGVFFLTVFGIQHYCHSRQRDVVIGMPIAGRPEKRFDEVIGHFINMIPIRISMNGAETFAHLAQQVQQTVFDGLEHSSYPFNKIVEDLERSHLPARSPVFQISFNYQSFRATPRLLALRDTLKNALLFEFIDGLYQTGEYPLSLDILPAEEYTLVFKYHPDLYSAQAIARLSEAFVQLVDRVLDSPNVLLDDLSSIASTSRFSFLDEWNERFTPYPNSLSCFDLFSIQAAANRDATAVSHGQATLTYGQLETKCLLLAELLQELGVRTGDRVGVFVSRSLDMIPAFLAVMKTGAAYVPLDPEFPSARLAHMIEDSGCLIILTQKGLIDGLPGVKGLSPTIVVVDGVRPFALRSSSAPSVTVRSQHTIEGLAYIIYTSGSTGTPKGVMISHRSLTNFLCAMQQALPFTKDDRILAVTTYSFDIAGLEMYLPLISGGHCIIAGSEITRDAVLLRQEIARGRPSFLQATPVTWTMLLRVGWGNPERVKILCGGEALPDKLKSQLVAVSDEVWNMYGPTETTIWSTMGRLSADKPVAVGQPIANTQIYIVDQELRPIPEGDIGELCISGDGVALGYYNNPALTLEKFKDNPFRKGSKIYRTGDLARLLEDGQLQIIGRTDSQIKLRGYRVELGEIEKALNSCPGIETAVAVLTGQDEKARIVAYFTAQQRPEHDNPVPNIDTRSLRSRLEQTLPAYMIPAEFIELSRFPLTPNGKLDRRQLVDVAAGTPPNPVPTSPAPLGIDVLGVFRAVLERNDIRADDPFFEIGGNSLKAIILMEKLNQELETDFPVTVLFKHPTAATLSNFIAGSSAEVRSNTPHNAASSGGAPIIGVPFESREHAAIASPDYYDNSLAIVGISCQFPGAGSHREFWNNLVQGTSSIRLIPPDELAQLGVAPEILADANYVAQQSSVKGKDEFDPRFFNLSPRDAALMDPQARLLLMHSWKAVEDAGYDVSRLSRTSVFMSASNNFYQAMLPGLVTNLTDIHVMRNTEEYAAWLLAQGGTIPTIISNKLGFTGPSIFLSTNCSSSLAALYLASSSLLNKEVDHALVGAASIFPGTSIGYVHQVGLNFSSDGKCKAFDEDADGMVGGEGVGVVMLKRMRDALRDGDHIYALLRGVALNNDGAAKVGFYAPSIHGQTEVIRQVHDKTQIHPETIQYVEAHGTGTKIGDPIEIASLTEAYRGYTQKRQFCAIGSVKTNIGHLDAAAGIAGLIKAALSLHNKEIPPTLNYNRSNAAIDFLSSPFYVASDRVRFKESDSIPLRAAVSAFGIGGTNAHAILEAYGGRDAAHDKGKNGRDPLSLVVCSAEDDDRLKDNISSLLDFIPVYREQSGSLSSLAFTLQVGRKAMSHRIAFAVNDLYDLEAKLSTYLSGFDRAPGCFIPVSVPQGHSSPGYASRESSTTGDLEKIANRWVNGEAIDWATALPSPRAMRVSLPTYSFAKRKCWITQVNPTTTQTSVMSSQQGGSSLDYLRSNIRSKGSQLLQSISPRGDIDGMVQRYSRLTAGLNMGLSCLLLQALIDMGMFSRSEVVAEIEGKYGILPLYNKWLAHTIQQLLDLRYLRAADGQVWLADEAHDLLNHSFRQWETWKLGNGEAPEFRGIIKLAEKMIAALPAVITGKIPATQLMFPDSSSELVEGVYRGNPIADYFNKTVANAVRSLIDNLLQQEPGRKVAILEVGAGTGSTTEMVLSSLEDCCSDIAEYCFTDLSKAFLDKAAKRFSQGPPYLRYKLFNAEEPPHSQGIATARYDIIVATNVLHATKDIDVSLANSMALLRKGGVLILTEQTDNQLWMHASFGLLHGWWRYQDPFRLPGGPTLSRDAWFSRLTAAGFRSVQSITEPDHALGLQVLTAVNDGEYASAPKLSVSTRITSPKATAESSDRAATNQNAPFASSANQKANDLIQSITAQCLATVLNLETTEIKEHESFSDYGLDSLNGVDFIHQLNHTLGVSLGVTIIFDYPSLNALATHVAALYGTEITQRIRRSAGTGTISHQEESKLPIAPISAYKGKSNQSNIRQPIAIIGISGRFPHANDVGEFWRHLAQGDDLTEQVTRWGLPQNHSMCPSGGFLDDIGCFDPLFFNISGLEASYMEPQQRIFLEETWKALEDAGYAGDAMARQACGVYVGCATGDYFDLTTAEEYPAQAFWGNMSSLVPARISYYLNLRGPAISIDTACSSSLVAIHLACQSLWSKENDLAIAGGIFVACSPRIYIAGSRAGMLSPSGHCYSFDDRADGFVPAEGVGVLILKRLDDALADRDHIQGVIRGSGINQDGTTNGITAPSSNSQQRLLEQVYREFDINCRHISMVEAHGTATRLGDPIEFQALQRAFASTTDCKQFCALGSVKANLGHAQMAAGVIGIIKVLLSMKHKRIPPSLHYATANSAIELEDSPFFVNSTLLDWKTENGMPRCAAVSSFGASGTNAHVVICEAPPLEPPVDQLVPRLIVLSARTEEQLREQATRLLTHCREMPPTHLGDMSYTLIVGRKHFTSRLAVICKTVTELEEQLGRWLSGRPADEVSVFRSKQKNDRAGSPQPNLAAAEPDSGNAPNNSVSVELEAAARRYVAGGQIPSIAEFLAEAPRRISLPTYPFSRERYWLDPDPKKQLDTADPKRNANRLAVTQVSSTSLEAAYKLSFNGEEFYLRDHKINNTAILPGPVYLELAREALCLEFDCAGGGANISLKNVALLQPLSVKEEPVDIQIWIRKASQEFEIRSENRSKGPDATVHCMGTFLLSSEEPASRVNFKELRSGMQPVPIAPEEFYTEFRNTGIDYGPEFRSFKSLYKTTGKILAELVSPTTISDSSSPYWIHPALVDGALQCLKYLDTKGDRNNSPSLLFGIRSVRAFKRCPPKVWALVTQAEAPLKNRDSSLSLDLIGEDGEICLRLQGISVRMMKPSGSKAPSTKPPVSLPKTATFLPVWEPSSQACGASWPEQAQNILVIGGFDEQRKILKSFFPSARFISFSSAAQDVDELVPALGQHSNLDHVIWLEPAQDAPARFAEDLLDQQGRGIVTLFHLIKAFLKLGYDDRPLGWTFITQQALPQHDQEGTSPAHSGISGFVGSLAKEYPNWAIRSVDVDEPSARTFRAVLTASADRDGNTRVFRRGQWFAQTLIPTDLPARHSTRFRKGGTYIIVGGAGGLGLTISEYLIREYAAQLIWLGRRPITDEISKHVQRLSLLGAAPRYIEADATDGKVLARVHKVINLQFGDIHGVIQAALVWTTSSIGKMSTAQFRSVYSSKVDVSIRVLNEFRTEPLDFVLFLSSINSYLKAMGQANYGAGCTFIDAFAAAQSHQVKFLVCVLNLGYCFNNASNNRNLIATSAVEFITESELILSIEAALNSGIKQMTLMKYTRGVLPRGMAVSGDSVLASHSGLSLPGNGGDELVPRGPTDQLASVRQRMKLLTALAI